MLIAGPTASGKSAVALAVAEAVGGVVVNADSMQVYRDLRVLTARPAPEDEARIPHRLYGHVDGSEPYSVGRWRADMADVLQRSIQRPHVLNQNPPLPVIIGGTGLYFAALAGELADVPPVPEEARTHWRARGLAEPPEALHAELARRDPVMAARLRPTDPQRIIRALEVIDGLGRSLAEFQAGEGEGLIDPAKTIRVVLEVEPEALRGRIDARFDGMMEAGALEEARALTERRLDPALPIMKAHGMPWLAAHLRGEMGLDEAITRAQGDTRRYAKRQRTWFRQRMTEWEWTAPERAAEMVLRALATQG